MDFSFSSEHWILDSVCYIFPFFHFKLWFGYNWWMWKLWRSIYWYAKNAHNGEQVRISWTHVGRVDLFVELRIKVSMDVNIQIEVFWVMTVCISHLYYEDGGDGLQNNGNACLTAVLQPRRPQYLWGVTSYSLVKVYCHFGWTYYLCKQGWRVSQANPEGGGRDVSSIYQTTLVTSQKILLFVIAAMTA
jgi:hypothetical protein